MGKNFDLGSVVKERVHTMNLRQFLFVPLLALAPSVALASDYVLAIESKGLREYYCTITVSLENVSAKKLTEISGFFYSYIEDEMVGRSKGAWFMNVEPSSVQKAVFETPNAPCDDVTRYEFVVGACRFDAGFEDVSACEGRLIYKAPLMAANPDD